MIARIIRWCMNNQVLVILVTAVVIALGAWSSLHINVDAIPDLSNVQVIIRTKYAGQAPKIIQDQVTYPLTTAMLAVPQTKTVRGLSMFGTSFVYVVFKEGTDLYWARSRVLEQLATVRGDLPADAKPQLGPDATGVGWIYQYALVTGPYSPKYPQGLWHDPANNKWYAKRADAPKDAQNNLKRVRIFPGRKVSPLDGKTKLVKPDVNLADLRSIQDWQLRYDLTTVQGVSQVASVGGFVKQYQITLNPTRMRGYHISLAQVNNAIKNANKEAGGRIIEQGGTGFMVTGQGYLGSKNKSKHSASGKKQTKRNNNFSLATTSARSQRIVRQLRKIAIKTTAQGVPVTLADIANVKIGPQIRRGILAWNNRGETAGGVVIMRFDSNARKVIARVKKKFKQIASSLPPGVAIRTGYDRTGLIDRAVSTLNSTLIEEILIVSIICAIFLFHLRSALVAAFVLPVAVLATLGLMKIFGITANIMSLGGIAIAIGEMVDSSIVMVENAHKHIERDKQARAQGEAGKPRAALIADAAAEVGPSLFFALLIIAVSFLPILILSGQSGKMFSPLAYTKTFAMIAAAVLAITIIPVLMRYFIAERIPFSRAGVPPAKGKEAGFGVAPLKTPAPPVLQAILNALKRWSLPALAIIAPAIAVSLSPLGTWAAYRWLLVALIVIVCSVIVLPQKLLPEQRNPINRLITWIYEPAFALAMRYWPLTFAIAISAVVLTIYPLTRLGSEFMPPLNEGTLLYMPMTINPGIAPAEAKYLLKQTNEIIYKFPAVKSVWGKVGRADTATDPMPMSVIETTIRLKQDKSKWRHRKVERFYSDWPQWAQWLPEKILPSVRPITIHELVHGYPGPGGRHVIGLDDALNIPGLANVWTMPIINRINMNATGIKTPIGIKVLGPNLATLSKIGTQIDQTLRSDPRTASFTTSASSDKATGGHYITITPNRTAIARYGLSVADVQKVVASAIGGKTVTKTVEGLGRFPVNVRYPRGLRDNINALKSVLVATPDGGHIPLGQVAFITKKSGPSMIKTENARPSVSVYVDINNIDVGSYVKRAKAAIADNVTLPPGYTLLWTGQYKSIQAARADLKIAIPLVAAIIVVLLLLGTRSWLHVIIVVLTEPFALAGAVWLTFLAGYNLSLTVWVGIIALAGIAAETGIVMLLYLETSYQQYKKEGRLNTKEDLWHAVHGGAVNRLRPMMMTVVAILAGLLPLLWAHGAGGNAMRHLAVPMIGGVITAFILELLIYPAIYYLARSVELGGNLDTKVECCSAI